MNMLIDISQKQKVSITQQLIQSIEILQMNTQELFDYLQAQATENPAIDIDELQSASVKEKFEWLRKNDRAESFGEADNGDDGRPNQEYWDNKENPITLQDNLNFQLSACRLSKGERLIAQYLIACVDSKGYLDEEPDTVAELLGAREDEVRRCVELLRSFSPPGVCSKDLKSCLLAQLSPAPEDELPRLMIQKYLDSVALSHFSSIAKELHVSLDAVRTAVERIRELSPIPAAGFVGNEETYYVSPDVQIRVNDGELDISIVKSFVPYLRLNNYYLDIYNETEDEALRIYLDKKFKAADWLMSCVQQRENTLLMCMKAIAERQRKYFLDGSSDLVFMSLSDVAEELGVHPSTVSRAIKNKYVQFTYGTIPVKSMFSKKLGNENAVCSSNAAKRALRELLEHEDKLNPLSDQQLNNMMKEKGIQISRRTVAKYRDELGVPGAFARKKADKR